MKRSCGHVPTIIDIQGLARHRLVQPVERGIARNGDPSPVAEASAVFCDQCGCSVHTDLIHPDGHHYSSDGDFFCSDCWEHSTTDVVAPERLNAAE